MVSTRSAVNSSHRTVDPNLTLGYSSAASVFLQKSPEPLFTEKWVKKRVKRTEELVVIRTKTGIGRNNYEVGRNNYASFTSSYKVIWTD